MSSYSHEASPKGNSEYGQVKIKNNNRINLLAPFLSQKKHILYLFLYLTSPPERISHIIKDNEKEPNNEMKPKNVQAV